MAETVLGDYTVVRSLADDPAYRWLKAAATGEQGRVYVLQIPQPDVPAAVLRALRDDFNALIALNHPNIRTPDACKGDEKHPLVIRYGAGEFDASTLAPVAPRLTPDGLPALRAWCRKAADALSALHDKGIVHGCLTADDLTLVGGQLVLAGVGYAPLLRAGHPGTLLWREDALAPEIRSGQTVTPAADVYGFARAVLALMPELAGTPWEERATDPDPTRRFSSIAETALILERAMEAYVLEPPTVRGQPSLPLAPIPPPQPTPKDVPGADVPATPSGGGMALGGAVVVSEARIPADGPGGVAILPQEVIPPHRSLDPAADGAPRGLLVWLIGAAIVIGIFALSAVAILPRLLPSHADAPPSALASHSRRGTSRPLSVDTRFPTPIKRTVKRASKVEKSHRER